MPLFQILLRAHTQEKQNGIPFEGAALLLFCTGLAQHRIPLSWDLDPVIIFFLETLIQLEKLHCKNLKKQSNHNFG